LADVSYSCPQKRTGEDGSTVTGLRQKTIMFFISFPKLPQQSSAGLKKKKLWGLGT
jgi:hypothetical protein